MHSPLWVLTLHIFFSGFVAHFIFCPTCCQFISVIYFTFFRADGFIGNRLLEYTRKGAQNGVQQRCGGYKHHILSPLSRGIPLNHSARLLLTSKFLINYLYNPIYDIFKNFFSFFTRGISCFVQTTRFRYYIWRRGRNRV